MIRKILTNLLLALGAERPTRFINPELALTKVLRLSKAIETDIGDQNDFIATVRAGGKIDEMLKIAASRGAAHWNRFDYGANWFRNEELRERFSAEIYQMGFDAVFTHHDSGGPEADSLILTIKVAGDSKMQ
jgi:hypothetical protein